MTLIKATILLSYYFKWYFILCTGIVAILCLVHQNFAKSNNPRKNLFLLIVLIAKFNKPRKMTL